ncbi:MAG: Zn-ribbon domain-containing OB-fold protein [Gammaproteobacteria bacterium]|nr:MAG: Zn-ribbon domain-containing OB-fold protein [Gammaproteobacteria bacterium]
MSEAQRNLPPVTVETRPFWEACRDGRLLLQQCRGCGHRQFYPRLVCSQCLGRELDWIEACGRGQVESFTIMRQAISPAYRNDLPYVVAIIRLAEGPTMLSNVIDCDPEALQIGMDVELRWATVTDEITLPKFGPA